jgi:hypothetical protein
MLTQAVNDHTQATLKLYSTNCNCNLLHLQADPSQQVTTTIQQLTACVHWPPNIPEPILDQILIQILLLLQSHLPLFLQLLTHSRFLPHVALPVGRKLKIN